MKRGQAATEFLITYGWAIMIVLVAIGALAYFGIMNPSRNLPDTCVFGNGVSCIDSQITTTQVHLTLVNSLGQTMHNPQTIEVEGVIGCTNPPDPWPSDRSAPITCTLNGVTPVVKEKLRVKLNIEYTKVSYTQIATGEVYATVQ